MNDLTPSYESETGQVILDGLPAGPAGEAGLVPVAGVDLAFDRADGHLVRAVVDADGVPATALLTRLFGPHAPARPARRGLAGRGGTAPRSAPKPGCARRCPVWPASTRPGPPARCRAARPGGRPRPPTLAERAGLPVRALAEARRAVHVWAAASWLFPARPPGRRCGRGHRRRHRPGGRPPAEGEHRCRGQPAAPARPTRAGRRRRGRGPGEGLRASARTALGARSRPHPRRAVPARAVAALRPARPARRRRGPRRRCRLTLAPVRTARGVGRCQVRLVDPVVRRVLARAGFDQAGIPGPGGASAPVPAGRARRGLDRGGRGATGPSAAPRRIGSGGRCAGRTPPCGPSAPRRASRRGRPAEDWAALAALAWERCRRDWAGSRRPRPGCGCARVRRVPAARPGLPGRGPGR